ncbi:hypothetical protein DIPPA_20710 [Diplonema papillatum]|nr:hypothetical protein DIPPA_20710 [Diplonema papillatum]
MFRAAVRLSQHHVGPLVNLPRPAGFPCRVYCDLDGVLADFETGLKSLGKSTDDLHDAATRGEAWAAMQSHSGFFSTLPWMQGGPRLWSELQRVLGYAPIILTGTPRGDWAGPQKREWCNERLGRDVFVIVCSKHRKKDLSSSCNVLIDDDRVTCENWKRGGGFAIHHTCPDKTIEELKAFVALETSRRDKQPHDSVEDSD